jgi:hypothetical protein
MNIAQLKRGPKKHQESKYSFESIGREHSGQHTTEPRNLQISNGGLEQSELQSIASGIQVMEQDAFKPSAYFVTQNTMPQNIQNSQLDFDYDFAANFALDPNVMLSDFTKPAPNKIDYQEPIQIDPLVLNYYTELNPKLAVKQELDQFLADTLQVSNAAGANLLIPELPWISTSFYVHLISMYFTYYHKCNPLIEETLFMEHLIPINKHHGMLLNSIYAIGCQYSRSPKLYQAPFYTPQKAFDYFINRALSLTPAPEVWGSINSDSLEICQAALLLSSCDYTAQKSHTWMMSGMAIRLALKFEMFSSKIHHDFFSTYGKIQKFNVACIGKERQRIWWGALMNDLFSCLSTGAPLLINEEEYVGTMTDFNLTVQKAGFSFGSEELNPIQNQSSIRSHGEQNTEKWMPFFSGFPKDTIFGASDLSSDVFSKESYSFFQIGHLFSDMNAFAHVIQLSFLTRRAIRLVQGFDNGKVEEKYKFLSQLISSKIGSLERLHDSLIMWFEHLPLEYKLWNNLNVCLSENMDAIDSLSANQGKRLSPLGVLLNMLFFCTMSILHQSNTGEVTKSYTIHGNLNDWQSTNFTSPRNKTFRLCSSLLIEGTFDSKDILRMSYRALIYLLRRTYGEYMPPSLTVVPPSEIVSSSIHSTLMMPVVIALLSQKEYTAKLIEKKQPDFTWDSTGIEPLEKVILPVLDNIGQVWSLAYAHANNLRSIVDKLCEKTFPNQHSNHTPSVMTSTTTRSNFNLPIPIPNSEKIKKPFQSKEKSWHDLRNEFEDEFLL